MSRESRRFPSRLATASFWPPRSRRACAAALAMLLGPTAWLGLASGVAIACDPTTAHLPEAETCEPMNPCIAVSGVYPFERVQTTPVYATGGCFAVARDAQKYVLLVTVFPVDPNPGFYLTTSTDGVTWTTLSPGPVFPPNNAWFTGIKCPDLQFRDDGKLHLYFKGQDARDGLPKFGHAVSSNYGRNWTIDAEPVFWPSYLGWEGDIDMPSILDTGVPGERRFVMAYYADPVGGPGLTGDVGVAFSDDGLVWQKHTGNPVVVNGSDPWNCRLAGRPRLWQGPDGSLHMFYAGTRICVKVLHAVSLDGGDTWQPDPLPVFDLADDPLQWDGTGSLYCTSFAWDPYPTRLQMFYTGGGFQVGLAEADWPLVIPTAVPEEVVETGARMRVFFATPNPFRGRTSLQSARVDGGQPTSIRIHDVSGRLVRVLWSGRGVELPLQLDWDGLGASGQPAPAGRYLATTLVGDRVARSHWLTLLR